MLKMRGTWVPAEVLHKEMCGIQCWKSRMCDWQGVATSLYFF